MGDGDAGGGEWGLHERVWMGEAGIETTLREDGWKGREVVLRKQVC